MSILGVVQARALVTGGLCAAAVVGGAGYLVLPREGSAEKLSPVRAEIADWRWAPRDELPSRPEPAEAPKPAAKKAEAVEEPEPTAAEAADAQASRKAEPAPDLPELPEAGSGPDDVLIKAEVLKNGVALPPLEAPAEVRAIFEAGNTIARSPYKWGGGHGKWRDNGYDCSGSVSYALAAAGLLDRPLASGPLMQYGKPGKGKWITIYTNPGHVFMVVAGVRFDTVARGQTGSRWINDMTSTDGYVARHPVGF